MGRSVAVPLDAMKTWYLPLSVEDPQDDLAWEMEYNDTLDNIRYTVSAKYPSLKREHRFANEAAIILENDHGCIAVAEYMGLLSISIVPRWSRNLAVAWWERATPAIHGILLDLFPYELCFCVGTASNGESFYQPYQTKPEQETVDALDR